MIPPMLATIYAFVFGLCVGSFLNVCVARWPRDLSVVRPRSRCPHCGHQLAWFENIPLLSWIALRARCRCCEEPISVIYPALELLVGVLWAVCVHHYGPTFTALRLGLFLTLLLGVAITDLQHYLIPDGFTITGLILMLAGALIAPFVGESEIFAGPFDALVGACAGAGLIAIVGWLGEAALGREAMGMGDMTLMAFVGAALGPARSIATVFVGATIGAVAFLAIVYPIAMLRRGRAAAQTELPLGAEQQSLRLPLVPFGVFLAPAAAVMLIWGDRLLGRVFFTPYRAAIRSDRSGVGNTTPAPCVRVRKIRRVSRARPRLAPPASTHSFRRHVELPHPRTRAPAHPRAVIDDSFRSERSDSGALARFTRDLTADARAERLEIVRCRDEEIARTIDILLRQGKNNPALVGAAGVGKTAIAEGLAQRIASGTVPIAMRDLRLLSLDSVALLAGTTYRGQYEERLRALVAETSAAGDVLLFVDEMHNLIGQGSASGSAMDAANMLKPALARGEFRMLGATTDEEYERWILGDPALERRFQKIAVRELSPAETLEILRTRIPSLAAHHHVVITDAAIRAAIELTDIWIPDRRRPDKAIDALDEACAHTQATAAYSPRLEQLIAKRRAWGRRAASSAGTARGTGDPQFDRIARDGFAVLERLGAQIEAAFAQPQPVESFAEPRPQSAPSAAASAPTEPTGAERAALDIELERQLLDEGIVVRGHDVARVVGLMIGRTVEWEE